MSLTAFFHAFKWDKELAYMFIIDVALISLLLGAGLVWFSVVDSSAAPVFAQYATLAEVQLENAGEIASAFKLFLFIFIGMSTLLLLISLFGYVFSRYVSWDLLLHKKIHKRPFLKMCALQVIWSLLWSPLFILLLIPIFIISDALLTNPNLFQTYAILIYILLLLFVVKMYFGLWLYKSFYHHHGIYEGITDAFKWGVKELPRMVLPLVYTVVVFILLWLMITGANRLGFSSFIFSALVILYAFECTRRYLIAHVHV